MDAKTNKPIANAWVVQEWRLRDRFTIPFSWDRTATHACAAGQFARTDSDGRFRFSAPASMPAISISRSAYAVFDPLIAGYELDPNRAEEASTAGGFGSSTVTLAVRPAEMSGFQIEEQAFAWLTGAGRCSVKPVPEELRVEVRDFLKTRGITRREMTERLTNEFSRVFRYRITESELLSSDTFANQKAALEYLGDDK